MQNIAIIPARGGSKRIKNKNIKLLMNKPLISYSIEYALNSGLIDKVYVSTDSEDIKKIGSESGATIISRPPHLANDYATSASALKHAVEHLECNDNDNIILLQPTNPLRPLRLLEDSLELFISKNIKSLFTVSMNDKKLGKIVNNQFFPYNYSFGQRSQDMQELFYENGLLYITKVSLLKKEVIINKTSTPYIVRDSPVIDIDTIEDFLYAEYLITQINYSNTNQ